ANAPLSESAISPGLWFAPQYRSRRRRVVATPLRHCAKRTSGVRLGLRPLLIRALEYDKERRQGLVFEVIFGDAGRGRRAAKRQFLLLEQLPRLEGARQANPRPTVLDLFDLRGELGDLGVLGAGHVAAQRVEAERPNQLLGNFRRDRPFGAGNQ